jgi:hypothetical protein
LVSQIGFSSGGLICRVRGSQVRNRALSAGNTSTWLGSQKSGGVDARVGGLRARLAWERAARCAFAACAVERRARTWVSGWDQGFGCWEFVDMAWVIKKWRRERACRGAARAASVGRCRSRCVGCMCGRAACAVCRRPAWRRGRRARAAHKYRLPAGGAFYRILSRNLEFDPFSKSHSWAGYVCFVLLRECISVSVTYGDSCN